MKIPKGENFSKKSSKLLYSIISHSAGQNVNGVVLENGKITNKVVREMMQVKESRAFKILKELVDMEIVEKRGKGKNSYYVMKER